MLKKVTLLVLFVLWAASCGAADLIVFSGAGLMKPMNELRSNFEAEHQVKIDIHYGSSGEIFGMLKMGQNCDVLIPGAAKYTYDALKNGWIVEDSIQKIVKHVPVIAVPKGNPAQVSAISDFADPDLKTAIGDPKSPAIGRVARKIFKNNGLWAEVKPNIDVYAPTVNQLLIYVAMEQVDAAIIWADLTTWSEGKGKLQVVDIDPAKNIIKTIPTAVTSQGQENPWAGKFNAYVSSEQGLKIWRKWGFEPCSRD
jgi:molybdate transport system substrate-binding protein